MRQSFHELWEAMEARRQQAEVGEGLSGLGFGRTRQDQRRGCPDEEALAGWADGELRLRSLWRWMTVWRHIRIGRCRDCLAEVEHLAEYDALAQHRPPRPGVTGKWGMAPFQMRKSALAWASSMLMIVVGLGLWSFGSYVPSHVGVERSGAPSIEETGTAPVGEELGLEAQSGHLIWGD